MIKNKLDEIVKFCIENVRYYAENLEYKNNDFFNMPIMTKDIYRQNVPPLNKKLLSGELKSAYIFSTSGTTSQPQYISREFIDFDYQVNDYIGLNIDENDVVLNLFWAGIWGIYTSANITLMKTGCTIIPFGGNTLTENELNNMVNMIKNFNVNTIFGVPSTIVHIANKLKDDKKVCDKIEKIFCLGEKMYEDTYNYLKTVFHNCNIKTKYGCMESAGIGYQCKCLSKNEYHVFDNRYVEILDDNNKPVKDGEKGKIVVTTLDKRLIPLLRYDTGDIGYCLDVECDCGKSKELVIEHRVGKIFIIASIHLTVDQINKIVQENAQELLACQLVIERIRNLDCLNIYIVGNGIDKVKIYSDIIKRYPDLVDTIKQGKMMDINILEVGYENLIYNKKTGKIYPLVDTRK